MISKFNGPQTRLFRWIVLLVIAGSLAGLGNRFSSSRIANTGKVKSSSSSSIQVEAMFENSRFVSSRPPNVHVIGGGPMGLSLGIECAELAECCPETKPVLWHRRD